VSCGWPPGAIREQNDDDDEKDCSELRAALKAVGRGSVRTGRRASPVSCGRLLEQIENENDGDDEKDCSENRAALGAAGKPPVRTEPRLQLGPSTINYRISTCLKYKQ
jgi:hypothetical protein